jgi:serine/threonine-protein kinase
MRARRTAPHAESRFSVEDPQLAGTIYNVTTGRAFFDDIDNARDRIIAHMKRDPSRTPSDCGPTPAAIAKLLRYATAREPADRPSPTEFAGAL